MTHQAREGETKYTDFCRSCQREEKQQKALADKSYYWTRDWVREKAPQWLRDHSIESRPYGHWEEKTLRYKTAFRKAQTEMRYYEKGQGWLLGKFDWEYVQESAWRYEKGTTKILTMLTDKGYPLAVEWQDGQLVYATKFGQTYFKGTDEQLAEAVRKVSGATALPPKNIQLPPPSGDRDIF